jgi:hypothetical protein
MCHFAFMNQLFLTKKPVKKIAFCGFALCLWLHNIAHSEKL